MAASSIEAAQAGWSAASVLGPLTFADLNELFDDALQPANGAPAQAEATASSSNASSGVTQQGS
jgi:hypothetical protein